MFNHDVLNFRVEKFDLGAFNPNFGGIDEDQIVTGKHFDSLSSLG